MDTCSSSHSHLGLDVPIESWKAVWHTSYDDPVDGFERDLGR